MRSAADIALQFDVEQLYGNYGAAIDDGRLDDWCELFLEDCFYAIIPRDNYERGLPLAIMRCESRAMLKDRARAIRETMMYEPRYVRHQITNVRILKSAAEIHAQANYVVFEVLSGELPTILSVGRSIDVITRDTDGALRFRDKRVVYDSVLIPNSIIYPL